MPELSAATNHKANHAEKGNNSKGTCMNSLGLIGVELESS
jgi:hypothetical protein